MSSSVKKIELVVYYSLQVTGAGFHGGEMILGAREGQRERGVRSRKEASERVSEAETSLPSSAEAGTILLPPWDAASQKLWALLEAAGPCLHLHSLCSIIFQK